MIIALRPGTEKKLIDQVVAEVKKLGYQPHPILGEIQTVIAAIAHAISATWLMATPPIPAHRGRPGRARRAVRGPAERLRVSVFTDLPWLAIQAWALALLSALAGRTL